MRPRDSAASSPHRAIFPVLAPTILAETASIFGETLLVEQMLANTADDQERLAIMGLSMGD
jgi:oligoendopeptidase F